MTVPGWSCVSCLEHLKKIKKQGRQDEWEETTLSLFITPTPTLSSSPICLAPQCTLKTALDMAFTLKNMADLFGFKCSQTMQGLIIVHRNPSTQAFSFFILLPLKHGCSSQNEAHNFVFACAWLQQSENETQHFAFWFSRWIPQKMSHCGGC